MTVRLLAALDVSLEKTSICVMDADGAIRAELVVASDPDAIIAALGDDRAKICRIGLEAGPLSEWIARGLEAHSVDVVLMETRQIRAALLVVKTDRKGRARHCPSAAHRLVPPVHVKTMDAREQRALLSGRPTLVARLQDIENSMRGLLRGFGLRVGRVLRGRWEAAVRDCLAGHPTLLALFEPLLTARAALQKQVAVFDKRVRDAVRHDPVCRRLMTVPGVGAIVAMTFRAAVDRPDRFQSSRQIGACFGLTPRKYQSGETDRGGAISRAGDASVRLALFEAHM